MDGHLLKEVKQFSHDLVPVAAGSGFSQVERIECGEWARGMSFATAEIGGGRRMIFYWSDFKRECGDQRCGGIIHGAERAPIQAGYTNEHDESIPFLGDVAFRSDARSVGVPHDA